MISHRVKGGTPILGNPYVVLHCIAALEFSAFGVEGPKP